MNANAIDAFQDLVAEINHEKGWDEDEDRIFQIVRACEYEGVGPFDVRDTLQTWLDSTRLSLIHSEVSEAMEEIRRGRRGHVPILWETRRNGETWYSEGGKPEGVFIELADAIVRIAHFFSRHGERIAPYLEEKVAYNRGRDYRHGNKRI